MARRNRVVLAGQVHHLMLLSRPGLFPLANEVVKRDLQLLMRQHAPEAGVAIHGFAMLPGELHVLITPEHAGGVSLWMKRLARFTTQAFNVMTGSRGSVWEGRFRCGLVAKQLSLSAMLVLDSLAGEADSGDVSPTHVHCSSAPHWLGRANQPWLIQLPGYWALANTPFGRQAAYRALLQEFITSDAPAKMLRAARQSWAQGPDSFLDFAEQASHQSLRPKHPGRPKGQSV